jgi:hypothetical protein
MFHPEFNVRSEFSKIDWVCLSHYPNAIHILDTFYIKIELLMLHVNNIIIIIYDCIKYMF